MTFITLPTNALNIVLNPEHNTKGEDYRNLWNNVLPTELNRLERLIAQTNGVLNSRLAPYRGTVTVGAGATTVTITHNLGILTPFTADVSIWTAGGVLVETGGATFVFTTDAVTISGVSPLSAGVISVLVLA